MPIAITYRGAGPWGAGQSIDLTADQINTNFYNLAVAVATLQATGPEPDSIASITVVGTAMTVHLQSGTAIGPIPLPFLRFGWKGPWTPETGYAAADVFSVDGQGIYFVNIPYTSGPTFDENQTNDGGSPLLIKLFGFDQSTFDTSYDVGFYYAGRLADQTTGYLYQEQLLRKITIPATTFHNAYLQSPATGTLTLPILYNGSQVGSIVFSGGANAGTFVWTAGDVTIDYRERLAVGLPGTSDATAAGLSVAFAAIRT